MPQNKQTLFFGVLLAVSLVSCGQVLFQESQTVPNKNWEIGNNITFDVEVKDTMVGYDFYIDLRNEANYPYANIYMFVNTIFPSGKSAKDTVECILADRTGRWLGNGLGDVIDNHILFKENIRFPNKGTYSFEFEQGMRNEALPAILDVGISIEKHTKK
jgi:gliding motility-associated lipoprotein GldH